MSCSPTSCMPRSPGAAHAARRSAGVSPATGRGRPGLPVQDQRGRARMPRHRLQRCVTARPCPQGPRSLPAWRHRVVRLPELRAPDAVGFVEPEDQLGDGQ